MSLLHKKGDRKMKKAIPREVELEDKPCPLGCPRSDIIVLRGVDRLHELPGEYTVVQCGCCGLSRTNPRPTAESIGYYYPTDYAPYQVTRVDALLRAGSASCDLNIHRLVEGIFRTFTRVIPQIPTGRLLEIGCASGSYLHRMASEGWEVAGIEFSLSAGMAARGLGYPVQIGSIESVPDPPHQYDLIVGWMVLEHLHEPVLALQRLSSWTKAGGWLAISVPNVETPWHRLAGNASFDLQLPNHLYHYTPRTIKAVLEAGGWSPQSLFHQKTLNTPLATLGNVIEDRFGKRNQLAHWFKKYPDRGPLWQLLFYALSFIFGVTGISGRMTIWAKKL